MSVFKAYDIRGLYLDELDENLAYRIGYFLPQVIKTDKIAVGRDARKSSPSLFESLREGIVASGASCVDIGLATTPYVTFATVFRGFGAAVQITASHNPVRYNGFKICRAGGIPVGYDGGLKELEDLVEHGAVVKAKHEGKSLSDDCRFAYLNYQKMFLSEAASVSGDLDVTFDLSNGVAAIFAEDLFGRGPGRHYICSEIDGSFPNHDPNPLDRKNCAALEKEVVFNGSDVGVIFDGDADRVIFIDDRGRFVQPDYIIPLIGYYYRNFTDKKGDVLCDIRTSKSTLDKLNSYGYTANIWKVGHSFAKKKLRELHGLFGGELAGHYYFRDFFYCDSGLHAACIVLSTVAALKKQGVRLSDFIDETIRYVNSGEVNFEIADKDAVVNELVRVYSPKALSRMEFDGIRYDFGSWWFNVRKSNTEPLLRLIVEADDRALFDEKYAEIESAIKRFS